MSFQEDSLEEGSDDESQEEVIERKVMFNDTFGVRGDYLKGLFYEVRRKYLKGEGDSNTLAPPEEMKSLQRQRTGVGIGPGIGIGVDENRRKPRKTIYEQAMEVSMKSPEKFHLQFTNKGWEEKEAAAMLKAQSRRREARKSKQSIQRIIIQKYSSTNPEDWEEDFQAGCRIWMNRKTGEVSAQCPWTETEGLKSITSEYLIDKTIINQSSATGALVYEGKEMQDLLHFLDNQARDNIE